MIVDLHTSIWNHVDQLGPERADRLRVMQTERWGHLDATPAAHERAMSTVDATAILGFRSDRLGAHVPNEYIAEYVAKDPRRRIGVAGIDPMSADADDQLTQAIELGLSAVTVSPSSQGFHPAHSNAMRIYERCSGGTGANTMPIFVTSETPPTAASELEFARPAHWDEVARAFPDIPIIIGQLGHPWIDETLLLLGKHPHVWADIASVASRPWQLYNALLSASSFGVMDKLLFGSSFPFDTPAKTIESLYSVNTWSQGTQLPTVPREQIRGIVERDAIQCLGLDTIVPARTDAVGPAGGGEESPMTLTPMRTTDDLESGA